MISDPKLFSADQKIFKIKAKINPYIYFFKITRETEHQTELQAFFS